MQYNEYLVIGTSPADGAIDIAVTTAVEVLFSEAIDSTTIKPSTVYLQNTSTGSTVTGTLAYNATDMKAVLTPSASLATATIYRIVVLGGDSGIMSLDGEYMYETKYYDFTTEGTAASEPAPEPEPVLLEVAATYPKESAVHVQPDSIKVLMTHVVDPLTVTHQSIYLVKKRKPESLNAIDLMTDFSPSKSVLNATNNPITLEQSNTLISIAVNYGDLEENTEYTLILRESIGTTTYTLGEAYFTSFHTVFNPLYADPEKIREDVGAFLQNIPEDILYRYTHDVSVEARDTIQRINSAVDLSNPPYYLEQYVRHKTAYDLAVNAYVQDSKTSGGVRTLGDLTVSKESGADITKVLRGLKDRIKPWEDQMHGHTNRGYARPSGVVKGENGDPYPSHLTRTEFRDL